MEIEMYSIERGIQIINDLGYLVRTLYQSHFGDWEISVRSPYEWTNHNERGDSMQQAINKAAKAMKKRGVALRFINKREAYHRSPVGQRRPAKKARVRLKKQRVRLN